MQYKLDQSRLAAKATSNGSNGTNGIMGSAVDSKLKRIEPIVENFPVTTLKSPVLPPTPVVRLNPLHNSVPSSAVTIN